MDAIYFLAALGGMGWLIVWTLREDDAGDDPAADAPRPWAPFDMKAASEAPAPSRPTKSRIRRR